MAYSTSEMFLFIGRKTVPSTFCSLDQKYKVITTENEAHIFHYVNYTFLRHFEGCLFSSYIYAH